LSQPLPGAVYEGARRRRKVPVAKREGGCLPNSPRRVRLPPGTLNHVLVELSGVLATLSTWRTRVQIPPRILTRRSTSGEVACLSSRQGGFDSHTLLWLVMIVSAGHWRAQAAGWKRTRLALELNWQSIRLLPGRLWVRPPPRPLILTKWACRLTGRRPVRCRRMRVRLPPRSSVGLDGRSSGFSRWVYETRLAGSAPARPTGSEQRPAGTRNCGEDQRQTRLPVHQGAWRRDPS
jgi:hypothetical protein